MKKIIVILLLLVSAISYSATFNSIQNGDWSNDNTWDGSGIPSANGDIIHIYHNVIMTGNITFSFDSLIIHTGGSLIGNYYLLVKAGCYLGLYNYLEVCDLEFANGSVVYISQSASLQVNCDFINRNNSDDVVINGSVNVEGNFDNGNGGEITGVGNITAGTFTGVGTTFGHTNEDVPPGTTVTNNPLPLTLNYFTAICENNTCRLIWETFQEINVDKYEIYRSFDAINYELILTEENTAGNTTTPESYILYDNELAIGDVYYKLKEIDFDGYEKTFDAISVNCNLILDINISPNPSIVGQYMTISGDVYSIKIYDILGREVNAQIINNQIFGINSGIYIVYLNGKLQVKIIIL